MTGVRDQGRHSRVVQERTAKLSVAPPVSPRPA